MRNTITETVTYVHHWNDTLFSFRTTRQDSFRFENGQFVMIGLEIEGKPIMRAYSIASANWEPELEFFSIKVPDGKLTKHLQKIQPGDTVTISRKPTGTLVAGQLLPGKNLYLLATGTGLAPFMSIIKDPDIYDQFEKIVLVHSVRYVSELAYQDEILNVLPNNEFIGDIVAEKLEYFPIVTREEFPTQERITSLLERDFWNTDPSKDRFMICGNDSMLKDTMQILDAQGYEKATSRSQGHYVIEYAFVEK